MMIPLGCRRSLVFLKEASDAEFERQRIRCQYPTRYVIIHLVILLQIELRVLAKRDSTLTPPASTCRVV